MEGITLSYGQKVLFPTQQTEFIIHKSGISSILTTVMAEFIIDKHWEDDTNANSHKVKLQPIDKSGLYKTEDVYSFDLKMMINQGTAKIID